MGPLLKITAAILIGVVIGAVALFTLAPSLPVSPFARPLAEVKAPAIPTPPVSGQAGIHPVLTAGDAPIAVYEAVSPAVVNISTTGQGRDVMGRSFQQQGTGSGFIIDNQGHIVTNQHVVSGASRLDITLADGSSYVGDV